MLIISVPSTFSLMIDYDEGKPDWQAAEAQLSVDIHVHVRDGHRTEFERNRTRTTTVLSRLSQQRLRVCDDDNGFN